MIGIDVVDVARLRAALARRPGMAARLFTQAERAYCESRADPVVHMAGTLAAKEAVIKALRLGTLAAWARRIEIVRDHDGVPQARLDHPHAREVVVSISHDGGIAAAVAVRGDLLTAS